MGPRKRMLLEQKPSQHDIRLRHHRHLKIVYFSGLFVYVLMGMEFKVF